MAERPVSETAPQEAATLVLRLGYRGAGFAGFARQPGQRTVAGEVEAALSTFLRRPVEVVCAGRTDAGVHAQGQCVSLQVTADELAIPSRRLLLGLSALLPDDISPEALWRARPGFSARFDALSRTYRYRICDGAARPVMAWDHAWWEHAPLDVEAMDAAAQALLGEHDFKSFCKVASAEGRPTCRRVDAVRVRCIEEAGERLVAVDITANAFLHSMVRTIVGSLVEVGRGRRDASWVAEALAARDRRAAGPTAPAKGLVFVSVAYPQGALLPWDATPTGADGPC